MARGVSSVYTLSFPTLIITFSAETSNADWTQRVSLDSAFVWFWSWSQDRRYRGLGGKWKPGSVDVSGVLLVLSYVFLEVFILKWACSCTLVQWNACFPRFDAFLTSLRDGIRICLPSRESAQMKSDSPEQAVQRALALAEKSMGSILISTVPFLLISVSPHTLVDTRTISTTRCSIPRQSWYHEVPGQNHGWKTRRKETSMHAYMPLATHRHGRIRVAISTSPRASR
ncbi:hypothetical protein C8R43DRAFT_401287 [Mycena crocata]|nr:hypothetical protein C8R43DRAFT_401287 [Mycena crocata]